MTGVAIHHPMSRLRVPLVLLVLALLPIARATPLLAQHPPSLLNSLFGDHAVLQRDQPVSVWGQASPGERVTVELGSVAVETQADDDGNWSAKLPPQSAGGPFALAARGAGGDVAVAEDVLIGDVFLCSGQSNMELPVRRSLNVDAEVAASANARIRMLTIGRASRAAPLDEIRGDARWEVAGPETVGDWSAVCYYFARELQRSVDVPIGLISSSWGGSDIRAWMSEAALQAVGGYDEHLTLLRLYAADERHAQNQFGRRWEDWWRAATDDGAGDEPWKPETDRNWPEAPEGLGDWKDWGVPELRDFNGMVWFRTSVRLTAEEARQDARLFLGGIDEIDQTWINGHVVGNTFGWGTDRTYDVPSDMLREGENVVVVNVLNTWGMGGMVGDPARRAVELPDGRRIPLDTWSYDPVPPDAGMPPRAPWESVGGLTTIHNAMVAPLRDVGLRGAAWYQGESNTGQGLAYRDLLQALIGQWRHQFDADLPVMVVQLANYGRPPTQPSESGWAQVREAQRLVARDDDRVGLVVTIDIGDAYDIHPPNKQEVGRRMARAARHIIYGEPLTPSGPAPAGAMLDGARVIVEFDDVDGSLVSYGHEHPIGFEVCGRETQSCRYVDARIEGRRVILQDTGNNPPTRVRYCWADSPICTLYDETGLPAGPFEVEVTASEQ